MAKLKNMFKQAGSLLRARHLELAPKSKTAKAQVPKIRSISTFFRYKQALGQAGQWAHQKHGITRLNQLTPEIANAYLTERMNAGIGQKQLDNDRVAMQYVVGKLDRLKTETRQVLEPRAYTAGQTERIAERQSPHNALATRIAYNAGLRAHELFTLRRASEAARTQADQWRDELFKGRAGLPYVVSGKGGLTRLVLIDKDLAEDLEARRLATPTPVNDRGVWYQTAYDIGGGNRWSKSFSTVSMRELGWSTGGHGLRHSYAQARLDYLTDNGHTVKDAKQLVSQELGHFRESVVTTYLR
jgi:integrase